MDFAPSQKQYEFLQAFKDPNYLEVLYGGAAGGGKSFILWWLMFKECVKHPTIRIGLARHTLTEIKKNTITTFYELMQFWESLESFINTIQLMVR
jgi:phage terminase large subunit